MTLDRKNKGKLIGFTVGLALAAALCFTYFWWFHPSLPARGALLSLMPGDAQSVLFADLGELRHAPFFTDLLAWAPKPDADADYRQFVRETGFDYEKDLERVVIAFEKQGGQQIFFAIADGRFNQEKIKAYATKAGATHRAGLEIFSVPIAGRPQPVCFTFVRKDRMALSNASDLGPFLKPVRTSGSTDWQDRFERVAGSPVFAVISHDGINEALGIQASSQDFARQATGGLTSPQLSSLLRQLRWITVAGKPDNHHLRVVAEGESSEDGIARQLADLLNGVVLLGRAGLNNPRTQQQIGSATHDSYLALLKSVDVSRIDRGGTKSVRVMFEVTPNLLKSAQLSAPVPGSK
jgi:hypothetical protein